METNTIPADEYAAGLERFQTMLAAAGSVVPADKVVEWYGVLVNGQQSFCDAENAEDARLYLLGSPLMPTTDGSYGRWQGWKTSDYDHANTPEKQQEALLRQPAPPFTKVVSLAQAWPDRVFNAVPVCPQPQVPSVATGGLFIGAPLANGWYAIVQGDLHPAGTLVNFNGAVLQRVVYPFGGWWAPGSTTQALASLPVAKAAEPIPTGGAV